LYKKTGLTNNIKFTIKKVNPHHDSYSMNRFFSLKLFFILFFLSFSFSLVSQQNTRKINALYKSLDPFNISKMLAFYELYPNTQEGQEALKKAFYLLGSANIGNLNLLTSKQLQSSFSSIISLVNKTTFETSTPLSFEELELINNMALNLPNRKLKGHFIFSEEEMLNIDQEDIDLSRGLLLSQLEDSSSKQDMIKQYEATLDLMALQILATLKSKGGLQAPSEDKISAMNQFIFNELHFRFPPHSSYAPDIDQYTFLPSVLDSRRGVCLGVSILYLCLAQRMNLDLEVITPPGHIYVRYKKPNGDIINIETTARGANTPTEGYLGINTKTLQQRTLKETIGLAHQNQASVYCQQENFEKAVIAYKKAYKYLKNDVLIKELLAYHLIFTGQQEEGKKLLYEIKDQKALGSISIDPMAKDYLEGKVDEEGIKAAFMHVDDTMQSIINKKERLEKTLKKYPDFKSGIAQLATANLQLAKTGAALKLLEHYHELDQSDPNIEYFLAILYFERFNWGKAWQCYDIAEALTLAQDHHPKALKEVKEALEKTAPK
jgi:regulator of sirC expression with transglutaminase-like and TPR domain